MKNKKYIYSHINPHTKKIFYIGAKMYENDRINDTNKRNTAWKAEVDKIGGFDYVIKRIEYKFDSDATISEMRAKEYEVAQYYYQKGENYCSFESDVKGKNNPNYGNKWSKNQRQLASERVKGKYIGENNPNYNNRWSQEQKDHLSNFRKGKYKGSENPNSKQCILYIADGRVLKFGTKGDMVKWARENMDSTLRTLKEGIPHIFESNKQQKYNGTYYEIIK